MLRLAVVLALLSICAGADAWAQLVPLGNTFDLGGATVPSTTIDGATLGFVAMRFTAHHSDSVANVGVLLAAGTNPDQHHYDFDIYDVAPDGGAQVGGIDYFSIVGYPSGGTTATWMAEPSQDPNAMNNGGAQALVAGNEYALVVSRNDGSIGTDPGLQIMLGAVGSTSSVDPVSGGVEVWTRTVLTAAPTGGNDPGWTDTGQEAIFYVQYQDDADPWFPEACNSSTDFAVDGVTYDAIDPVAISGAASVGVAGEAFLPAAIQETLPQALRTPLFAVEMPLDSSTPASGVLLQFRSFQSLADGGLSLNVDGVGKAAPTVPYGSGYTWWHASITSNAQSALVIPSAFVAGSQNRFAEVGDYAQVAITGSRTGPMLHLPLLEADAGAFGCEVVTRAVYLSGDMGASVTIESPDGGQSLLVNLAAPFRLCTSEVAGNGIDEDCSGLDGDGGLLLLCHDPDGGGHGIPSDWIEVSAATYEGHLPTGYVHDCGPGCAAQYSDGGESVYDVTLDECQLAGATFDPPSGTKLDAGTSVELTATLLNAAGGAYLGGGAVLRCDGGESTVVDGGSASVLAAEVTSPHAATVVCEVGNASGSSSLASTSLDFVVPVGPSSSSSSSSSSAASSSSSSTSSSSSSSTGNAGSTSSASSASSATSSTGSTSSGSPSSSSAASSSGSTHTSASSGAITGTSGSSGGHSSSASGTNGSGMSSGASGSTGHPSGGSTSGATAASGSSASASSGNSTGNIAPATFNLGGCNCGSGATPEALALLAVLSLRGRRRRRWGRSEYLLE